MLELQFISPELTVRSEIFIRSTSKCCLHKDSSLACHRAPAEHSVPWDLPTAAAKHMGTELQPLRRAPTAVVGLGKKRKGKGKDLGGLSTGQAVWSRGDSTSFGKQQDTYGRACAPGDSTGEQLLYTVSQIRDKTASKGWMGARCTK